MKFALPFFIFALAVVGPAQDQKTGLGERPKAKASASGYVTTAEAMKVFSRVEGILRKVSKTTGAATHSSLAANSNPASRSALITEFGRLYRELEPAFKVTPMPVKINSKIVKMSNAQAKGTLMLLIKEGAVANYGPLATGPQDRLTLAEFGDAIGFFMSRMAEMTHMPSTKYTPALMGPGG